MEGNITSVVSENSAANLRGIEERRQIQQDFKYGRASIISQAKLAQDKLRFRRLVLEANGPADINLSREAFLMELAARGPMNCSQELDDVKEKQARVIALNRLSAKIMRDDLSTSEFNHHSRTRMDIFFENPHMPEMAMSEKLSSVDDAQSGFESFPNGSASVINELIRLERERGDALVRADDVVYTEWEGNPYNQRSNVFERMWVLVSEKNPIWNACCLVFTDLRDEAQKSHRQIAACKNCATIFSPFFPDEYHMHQMSVGFKSCLDPRSAEGDRESLLQRALIGLAQEAKAYKKDGDDEYIKIIRMVKGVRGHRVTVKYDRLELCENHDVECCESLSMKTFKSHNLAVGVLKLVIQLHFKIPISSKLMKYNQHGAGLAGYFQRYRRFVPEFSEEILFRCFLIEFGQHVKRTDNFDHGFMSKSNWWSGRSITPESTFVTSGSFGMLIKLDKSGLVQLAKSLADGTGRVFDDFCRYNANEDFLSCLSVDENVDLQQYLEHMPEGVENEPVERELLPILRPLLLVTNPEVRDAEKNKKISESMISKRAPDIESKELARLEHERQKQLKKRERRRLRESQKGST